MCPLDCLHLIWYDVSHQMQTENAMHQSSIFSYHNDSKTFVADISDLGNTPFTRSLRSQYGLGMAIVSAKTGIIAQFAATDIVRDEEREIVKWVFSPTSATLHACPELTGVTACVYND